MDRRSFLRTIGFGIPTGTFLTGLLAASCGTVASDNYNTNTAQSGAGNSAHIATDVAIYGAISGGVIAAYTARQYGKRVLLIELGRHIGGLTSGGLGRTDVGDQTAITGLSRDFYRRIGEYYGSNEEMWRFEPHVAEQIFEEYLDEADVEILYSRRVKDVQVNGGKIRSISLQSSGDSERNADITVDAHMFIDATYEGDLMAMAGVSYYVGREPNSMYNETHNGVQMGHPRQFHQFPDGIDPYVKPGRPSSGLLPEISGIGVGPNGSGDKKMQAYNFRMCLTQNEENQMPFPKPPGYDPDRYELLLRVIEQEQWESIQPGFIISEMPRGKTDWNNRGPFSTDYIGKNWEYPEADYATRKKIWREHEHYQKGLMYFYANDERVPSHLRKEMNSWGLCRDEFLDTDGWPHALYIREGRRMIGSFVMTDNNIAGGKYVQDGIAYGSYNMDSHNVQRFVLKREGGDWVKNEGDVEQSPGGPYPISYRSLVPGGEEVTNLLVPTALSSSHIAFGSIRMEPVFMELGQAAAVAASLALDNDSTVQEVNVQHLQRELHDNPLANRSREIPSDLYRLKV